SQSEASHRLAMSQMRGGFSKQLSELRDQLLQLTSLLELELDFSDHEDVEFADRSQLRQLTDIIRQRLSRLTESFQMGNAIKQGVPIAIVGDTNVGKSTLLNALLNDDKAIVSDIPGTTRDVVEDTIVIDGVLFRFIDTAGIRSATDTIEHLGIERTFCQIARAQIVLWVIDGSQPPNRETASQIVRAAQGKTLIRIINKSDLPPFDCADAGAVPESVDGIEVEDKQYCGSLSVHVSAKQGNGLQQLQTMLLRQIAHNMPTSGDVVVTNQRHYEALSRALASIRRVQEGIEMHLSGDLVCEDLRQCLFHLSEIVGEVTTDDVLQNIFSHFCIGK
ncbi:MAG: 50S ribosome-binding GTPase, partial [Bacteroidales bacterium]|nr:50S ribosome-binding GTPase [Bacteroidales bacterium]